MLLTQTLALATVFFSASVSALPSRAAFTRNVENEIYARDLSEIGLARREDHPAPDLVAREVEPIVRPADPKLSIRRVPPQIRQDDGITDGVTDDVTDDVTNDVTRNPPVEVPLLFDDTGRGGRQTNAEHSDEGGHRTTSHDSGSESDRHSSNNQRTTSHYNSDNESDRQSSTTSDDRSHTHESVPIMLDPEIETHGHIPIGIDPGIDTQRPSARQSNRDSTANQGPPGRQQ